MTQQARQQPVESTHERRDVDVIGLLMIGGLLAFILGISFLVCWGILHRLNRTEDAPSRSPTPKSVTSAAFSSPHLLVVPGKEWREVQGRAEAQLNTYGWLDRSAGIARIPIARAMELLAERGVPEAGAGQTRLQLMQARPQTEVQPNEPITSPTPEVTQ